MSPSIKANVDVIEGEPGDLTKDLVLNAGPLVLNFNQGVRDLNVCLFWKRAVRDD